MLYTCNNIENFIKYKNKCIFCKNELSVILTNFSIGNSSSCNNPIKLCTVEKQTISFILKYHENYPGSPDIYVNGLINIKNNNLTFRDVEGDKKPIYNPLLLRKVLDIFNLICPHVELRCNNKYCKYSYYISSDIFKYNTTDFIKINPFSIYMECFSLDNLWVQNNFARKTTYIYSTNNEKIAPIKIPIIDFSFMEKDKIINKIKTIVIFS